MYLGYRAIMPSNDAAHRLIEVIYCELALPNVNGSTREGDRPGCESVRPSHLPAEETSGFHRPGPADYLGLDAVVDRPHLPPGYKLAVIALTKWDCQIDVRRTAQPGAARRRPAQPYLFTTQRGCLKHQLCCNFVEAIMHQHKWHLHS